MHRGDNRPVGSFDLVECHILMTLSTQSSYRASSWYFFTPELLHYWSNITHSGGTEKRMIDGFARLWFMQQDELEQRRKSRSRRICQGLSCHPWLLPFIVSLIPCLIFSPPLLKVVMTILNTVSMERGWAPALSPIHSFVQHCGKGTILTSYLAS